MMRSYFPAVRACLAAQAVKLSPIFKIMIIPVIMRICSFTLLSRSALCSVMTGRFEPGRPATRHMCVFTPLSSVSAIIWYVVCQASSVPAHGAANATKSQFFFLFTTLKGSSTLKQARRCLPIRLSFLSSSFYSTAMFLGLFFFVVVLCGNRNQDSQGRRRRQGAISGSCCYLFCVNPLAGRGEGFSECFTGRAYIKH